MKAKNGEKERKKEREREQKGGRRVGITVTSNDGA